MKPIKHDYPTFRICKCRTKEYEEDLAIRAVSVDWYDIDDKPHKRLRKNYLIQFPYEYKKFIDQTHIDFACPKCMVIPHRRISKEEYEANHRQPENSRR